MSSFFEAACSWNLLASKIYFTYENKLKSFTFKLKMPILTRILKMWRVVEKTFDFWGELVFYVKYHDPLMKFRYIFELTFNMNATNSVNVGIYFFGRAFVLYEGGILSALEMMITAFYWGWSKVIWTSNYRIVYCMYVCYWIGRKGWTFFIS